MFSGKIVQSRNIWRRNIV